MKPISISLSPNVEKDDVKLALKLIFSAWGPPKGDGPALGGQPWKEGSATKQLEETLKKYLGVKYVFSFNSGRSALFAIFKSLNLPQNTEVLLQAFTCNAAVNPVLWANFKPIYVDCDPDTYNIDISDLGAKISSNSRVLMVQHTFGLPANIDEILAIAQQNNLILIEDCAHSLGAEFRGQKVGTFGKAAFFSFGRDKIISSVYGGMAVTNDDQVADSLYKLQKDFGSPSYCWILQQLLHPILMNYVILPLYNILDLGKIFLVLSQWFGILSKAVNWKEKMGQKPSYFPRKLPNALAVLALNQFRKLDRFYEHRKQLSQFYYNELKNTAFKVPESLSPEILEKDNIKHSFLRFTIKHPKAHEIIYESWHKQNILVGDWYASPVIPIDTDLKSVRYEIGSCPIAEKLAKTTLNLPTHINISEKDAEKIVNFLKQWK